MKIKKTLTLITGAASGLGKATARLLATERTQLILLDRNEAALATLAAELKAAFYVCDVADEKALEAAFDALVVDVGVPRILINCAGIAPAARMVTRDGVTSLDFFRHVLQVNLLGTFNVMRLGAAAMMSLQLPSAETERGVIIHTASTAAFDGQIGQTAYSAAKGGIVSLILPAARELASQKIRVMGIAPGVMNTAMLSDMPEAVQTSLSEQIPFPKRLGEPKEYAELARHIIENPYLNGSVIRLDGGLRMQAH